MKKLLLAIGYGFVLLPLSGVLRSVAPVAAGECSLIVTTTNDGGPGSLRAAINCANQTPGPDTIMLPAGIYKLTIAGTDEDAGATGDLDITDSLTIIGAGTSNTIIDADHLDRIFDLKGGGTNHLTLSSLTLQNGQTETDGDGGAIRSQSLGDLTLDHCLLLDNTAALAGGGIVMFDFRGTGNLVISDSSFSNNRSGGGQDGGAIFYDSQSGRLTVTRSRFENNTSAGDGGAIEFIPPRGESTRQFQINDCTFINNQAATADAEGGAVYICCDNIAAAITGSTFTDNSADSDGGALYTCCSDSSTLVSVTNSTFSANKAQASSGGAIEAEGPVTLVSVTLSGNSAPKGAGIWNDDDRDVTLLNTLFANNTPNNLDGSIFVSLGHNLSSDHSGEAWLMAPGDLNNTDPRLGPLADNGGPTQTHALPAGSPAIDAGDNNGGPATDQRGIARPQGAAVDIGAYESGPAGGCSLQVTTTNDGGPGSLRAAIICANSTPGPDTINLPVGIYTLTIPGANEDAAATGDLDITDDLTISGAGAEKTIIDGGGLDRVFQVIGSGKTINFIGLTIRNGKVNGDGGGINNQSSSMSFLDCTIMNNTASINGGGIANTSGDLTFTNVVIQENTATAVDGGGIFNGNGDLAMDHTTISGNVAGHNGGGIANNSGDIDFTHCLINSNRAQGIDGGGIYNGNGDLNFLDTSIGENLADANGGGIANTTGDLKFIGSTISSNFTARLDGGAIANSSGDLTLVNCTISCNQSAAQGGGISSSQGNLSFVNVTVAKNRAAGNGGGLLLGGNGTLLNTILAGNSSRNGAGPDCFGTLNSQGHNLIQNTNGCVITGVLTGNLFGVDPVLGPLIDNGGATETDALLAGSPAIDAGDNNGAPATDQRGVSRPKGAAVDIGAFEADAAPPAAADLALGLTGVPIPVFVGNNLIYTIVVTNQGPDSATGLVVTSRLPPSVTFISASGSATPVDTVLTFPLGALKVGASTNLVIVVRATAEGAITNLASVSSALPDPDSGNNSATQIATVVTAPAVDVQILSPIVLNRQTGLFEQTVRFSNLSTSAVAAVNINIRDLPSDVIVYNASATAGDVPFVHYGQSVSGGGSVDFLIEYYRLNRVSFDNPSFASEVTQPVAVPLFEGVTLKLDRNPQSVNGRVLIEFSSIPGDHYSIQYSGDMTLWKAAWPPVTAAGTRVQWLDDGPPKTETKPTVPGSRFYRVVRLP